MIFYLVWSSLNVPGIDDIVSLLESGIHYLKLGAVRSS